MSDVKRRVAELEKRKGRSDLPFWVDWWSDPNVTVPDGALTLQAYREKHHADPDLVYTITLAASRLANSWWGLPDRGGMMSKTLAGRIEALEAQAASLPDDDPDVVHILVKGDAQIRMSAQEWSEYMRIHPGDYITVREIGG